MSEGSTSVSIELPNGAKLTWVLSWDDEEDYISLNPLNFTTDPLGRVSIQQGTQQNTVGRISSVSNENGLKILLTPLSIEDSFGSI